MYDLSPDAFPGGYLARGINDLGQVAGTDYTGLGEAVLFSNGETTHLGTLGGIESQAWDINNSGQVVGSAETIDDEEHAFLYDGTMHDLGTLGGNFSVAKAINNSGQVVGLTKTPDRAFLYSDGTMHDLGVLDAGATDINDLGHVVGVLEYGPQPDHFFLYTDGTMHDLGTFDGRSSRAAAINNSGQIVGASRDEGSPSNYRPFLYSGGTVTDLNDLLPESSPWELVYPFDINDSGHIVGYGRIGGEEHHRAFLLIPEPSTLALLSMGALALLAYAWRRKRMA